MMRAKETGERMSRRISYVVLALLSLPLLVVMAHAADFDPKAATETYLATVAGEARAKSNAYFEGGYWLILWDALYAIVVAAILLFTRVAAGLRNITERMLRWRWLQTLAFAALFIALTAVLTFPLTIYENFYREHEFGLSNQTLQEWFRDFAVGVGVNVVLSSLFVVGIYAVIRRAPRTWWIWGAAVTAVFLAVSVALAPVYISPLFNDYRPMREGQLKQDILSLARANGIPVTQVYEFDASKQSKRISANVSGFLGTTRISLNDNLLNRTTPAEVRAVMGHEMGHYVLNHVGKLIVYLALLAAFAFAFMSWGFGALHRVFGGIWGVRDIADPAGLPVFVILASFLGVISTPVTNSIVRENEAQADIFGLNAAREPDGFATTALKLSEYRKLDPTPLEEMIFFDHPSGRSRIWMSMQWKAEHLDELARRESVNPGPQEPITAPPDSPPAAP